MLDRDKDERRRIIGKRDLDVGRQGFADLLDLRVQRLHRIEGVGAGRAADCKAGGRFAVILAVDLVTFTSDLDPCPLAYPPHRPLPFGPQPYLTETDRVLTAGLSFSGWGVA